MPYMVKAEVMHNHAIPISLIKLPRNMPCDVIVDLCKILYIESLASTAMIHIHCSALLTETKKLEVPSARSKKLGNSFSQVSSPYMTNFPPSLFFSCESHVSWFVRLDVVSDSAKLRMTSRNDGMDPVVIALTRGIVIVGDVAWAVKGNAKPDCIKLPIGCQRMVMFSKEGLQPLDKLEA